LNRIIYNIFFYIYDLNFHIIWWLLVLTHDVVTGCWGGLVQWSFQ